ncbi:hypothetical protein PUNSTDRAFT_136642 [Punctularia strigosozonata HHB-11173 SS5]|uniref:uncharacterized protein n=1 Tax=Punctularia strigosozonata (strain HHB-11173) TaxID=741275 RepID=UPI00044171CB|nr:uncharacterized protein PUNSTDRAFT_136642 [Punctularia strigosozonata HHB-11173 SS5]EIN06811.1 hypothetical protein PUNSTDRAFT_136642 [Punctularia strigosozonata HHB-11173 SS5]
MPPIFMHKLLPLTTYRSWEFTQDTSLSTLTDTARELTFASRTLLSRLRALVEAWHSFYSTCEALHSPQLSHMLVEPVVREQLLSACLRCYRTRLTALRAISRFLVAASAYSLSRPDAKHPDSHPSSNHPHPARRKKRATEAVRSATLLREWLHERECAEPLAVVRQCTEMSAEDVFRAGDARELLASLKQIEGAAC